MRLSKILLVPAALAFAPALAGAILAASAVTQAQVLLIEPAPMPAPYGYYDPGLSDGPGSCYYDSLSGRVCRD